MMIESINDKYLQEDLDYIAENTDLSDIKNKSVLVTGATGLVGSRLVLAILCCNRLKGTGIRVYALVRNEEKAKDIYGSLLEREDIELVKGDLTEGISIDEEIDYIIHCASVTASKTMVEKPVETIKTALKGTESMLELAKVKNVRSMVYVSSMEMYGSFTESDDVTEDKLGYIDPLAVRSNYPESKRMCENMCIAYAAEYGVPVKIARLSQVFGAGVLPGENRVFAQFARSVMNGTDIVLHTLGKSEGNYCYLSDAVRALIILLSKGRNGEAYNISNPASHTTIADMAHMAAERLAGGKIKVVFDIPESNVFGYANDTRMKLNSDKMQALGWQPTYNLEQAYKRLILSLKEAEGQ
ncbi:MAG: NAD-dependent epimerase/dehydratase family protein [Candidatus Ornithomonoglobus sp.]